MTGEATLNKFSGDESICILAGRNFCGFIVLFTRFYPPNILGIRKDILTFRSTEEPNCKYVLTVPKN